MTYSKANPYLIFITLAIICGVTIVPSILEYSLEIFLVMVVLFGIPHGALDHLMHFKSTKNDPKNLLLFYSRYLGLVFIIAAVWYFLPKLMFIVFLLISAHHFGQSQLFVIKGSKYIKHLFYACWGTLLLSAIIFYNYPECLSIFTSITWLDAESWLFKSIWSTSLIISAVSMLALSVFLIVNNKQNIKTLVEEWVILALLILLSIKANAVIAFAVYFGLWHSLRSLLIEYKTLSNIFSRYSIGQFLVNLAPFTLLAIFFLVISYFIFNHFSTQISLYMFFIIFISTLTVPHLFVMNDIYEEYGSNS